MRRLFNSFFWLVGFVVVLGVYFFVPLGRYTLFEHTLRIAATEPAQELADELTEAGERLGKHALEQWEEREALRREASEGSDEALDASGAGAAASEAETAPSEVAPP